MPDDTIPAIAFDNQLAYDVIVYDSSDDDDDDDTSNSNGNGKPDSQAYYGTLTQLGKVPAGTKANIQPIYDSSAFVVESVTDSKPVKRMVAFCSDNVTSLSILKDDEDAMAQTFQFVSFYLNNPDDPISVSFAEVWNNKNGDKATNIDAFFAAQPAYSKCIFENYMMALAYTALHPVGADPSQPNGTYSLKIVTKLMGSKWPESLADIFATKFTCTNKDKAIKLVAEIDINTLPFASLDIADNVKKLLTTTTVVKAEILFNYAIGLNIFGTRLMVSLDALAIPVGEGILTVNKPSISIDINPLFKFVVLTIKGYLPFTINGKTFDTEISFAIDNDEAEVGVVIEGDNTSLPAPPGVKGLFFDQFGVGIGVFFKPPGDIIGIQGKFHIGQTTGGNIVSLDDDTFALVCKITGDAITPAFASFYIPKMDLNTVVELFTNRSINLDLPVHFEDLSFRWVDELMSAYVLPDGTLTDSGYGFSAACNIGSFGFYGDVELDLSNGLTADVEVSPIDWKNVFRLTGDGKGYSIKIDAAGNPIKNNFVPKTAAGKVAVAKANSKQIVRPGGAVLIINTLSMPILHLNAKASLFDLVNCDITADINKDGIRFELDYGAVLTQKMVCNLTDFYNFYGEFGYYIDKSIPVSVNGVNLGSIPLKADIDAHLSIATSTTDVVIKTGGQFDFESYHFTFGDFTADISLTKMEDFIGAIAKHIEEEAKTIFSPILDTAEHWAKAARKGIVTGFDNAGEVMKNVYGKTKEEMAPILKEAGFAANDIAKALKEGYGAASQEVASLLKAAGFDPASIGAGIKYAWQNCVVDDVSWAMCEAGYGAEDVARAVKGAFNSAAAQDVFTTLRKWGCDISHIAKAMADVCGMDSPHVAALFRDAGYAIDTIGKVVQCAFQCGMDTLSWTMVYVGYGVDDVAKAIKGAFSNADVKDIFNTLKKWSFEDLPTAKAINGAFGTDAPHIVAMFRDLGYGVDTMGTAVQYVFNSGADGIAWAMHYVGYGAEDAAKVIKSAFSNIALRAEDVAGSLLKWEYTVAAISGALYNVITQDAQDVANTFKGLGIIAQDTANALQCDFQKTINDAASIMKQAGYVASDVASSLKNAFNTTVDAVGDAMKGAGYAANDVKNAFDELGGDFKSFADSVWGDAKHYLNPSNW